LKRELDLVERLRTLSAANDGADGLGGRLKRLRLHTIADDATMTELDQSSRLQLDARLLQHLRRAGRTAATRWLDDFRAEVATRPSATLDRAG
jgi:hypothetical protein